MPREYSQEVLYMSAADVAKMLNVHNNTIKRIPPDELPYIRIGHRGDRRYRTEDVLAYLKRNRVS